EPVIVNGRIASPKQVQVRANCGSVKGTRLGLANRNLGGRRARRQEDPHPSQDQDETRHVFAHSTFSLGWVLVLDVDVATARNSRMIPTRPLSIRRCISSAGGQATSGKFPGVQYSIGSGRSSK